jgi:hypothetical protein
MTMVGKYEATGADFNQTRKQRDVDNKVDADLPPLPFRVAVNIRQEYEDEIKNSIWVQNFKRAIRGMLRSKPPRAQGAVLHGLHEQSAVDADKLGLGPKDSFQAIIDKIASKYASEIIGDIQEGIIERGLVKASDTAQRKNAETQRVMRLVFGEAADEKAKNVTKRLYEKYNRGQDFETSDVELSDEEKAKMDAEKQEKLKKMAEERQRQSEQWKKEAAEAEEAEERRRAAVAQRVQEQKQFAEKAGVVL